MKINFSAPVSLIKPISNHHLLKASPYLCIFTGRIDGKNKLGKVYYVRPEIYFNSKAEVYIMNFNKENNLINYNSNIVDNVLDISGQIIISDFKKNKELNDQVIAVNLLIKNLENVKINAITINNGSKDFEMGLLGKVVYFIYIKKYWINKKVEYFKNSSQLSNLLPKTNLIEKISKNL